MTNVFKVLFSNHILARQPLPSDKGCKLNVHKIFNYILDLQPFPLDKGLKLLAYKTFNHILTLHSLPLDILSVD